MFLKQVIFFTTELILLSESSARLPQYFRSYDSRGWSRPLRLRRVSTGMVRVNPGRLNTCVFNFVNFSVSSIPRDGLFWCHLLTLYRTRAETPNGINLISFSDITSVNDLSKREKGIGLHGKIVDFT